MPGQTVRKKSVQQKLNALDFEFQGKNVLIVDDSIVRGTTSQEIIQMARNAGANKVYFASASPPIRHPHIYGIDMPQVTELIAYQRSVTEIQHLIQADKLIYLDLADLVEVAREGNPKVIRFEASVFDGQYITGDEQAYLTDIAQLRGESALN
jgi:amidophosphoribosyltransferase